MYRDTITLFNFCEGTGLWYPSVFSGADLGVNTSSDNTTTGKTGNDTAALLLHCTRDKLFTTADGVQKPYINPKEYAACEDPAAYITFKPECDFFYKGVWAGTEELRDENYEAGLYHAMHEKYDGVYMVNTVAFFDLLPHAEIGGR